MNLKPTSHLLILVVSSVLFFQCSKDDQLNQVGTWDAKYFSAQFENDSVVFETISNVEMTLKSDETGIVKGALNEGTLEWDLIYSDTEINLIEKYALFGQSSVLPQETGYSTIYKILANESKFQEWHYELEFILQDSTVRKITKTWRLSRE